MDGCRAIAAKANGRPRLWSRNENDFGARYPGIAEALANLPEETVVDGEIVALDKLESHPSTPYKNPFLRNIARVFSVLPLRSSATTAYGAMAAAFQNRPVADDE